MFGHASAFADAAPELRRWFVDLSSHVIRHPHPLEHRSPARAGRTRRSLPGTDFTLNLHVSQDRARVGGVVASSEIARSRRLGRLLGLAAVQIAVWGSR